MPADFDEEVEKQRLNRLNFLLEKTSLYSNFLSQKLALAPQNNADASEDSNDPDSNKKRKKGKSEVGFHFSKSSDEFILILTLFLRYLNNQPKRSQNLNPK